MNVCPPHRFSSEFLCTSMTEGRSAALTSPPWLLGTPRSQVVAVRPLRSERVALRQRPRGVSTRSQRPGNRGGLHLRSSCALSVDRKSHTGIHPRPPTRVTLFRRHATVALLLIPTLALSCLASYVSISRMFLSLICTPRSVPHATTLRGRAPLRANASQ